MRFRHLRVVLGVLLILLIPRVAFADRHRAGLGGGPSYGNGSALFGFNLNFDWSPDMPKGKYLSLMADYSALFDDDTTLTTFAGGLSLSRALTRARAAGGQSRFVYSGHGLIAGIRSGEDTDFGGAVGTAFEYVPRAAADGELAYRVQYDYFFRGDGGKDFNRVVVGIVYRWLKPEKSGG
jgi:hypothetical protein